MGNSAVTELCDVFHYDVKKGKRVKIKECELISMFLFSRNDFCLSRKGGIFFISILLNGDAIMVWYHPEIKNGEKFMANDIISMFRTKYVKAGITQKDIDNFIENPIKYEKNRRK